MQEHKGQRNTTHSKEIPDHGKQNQSRRWEGRREQDRNQQDKRRRMDRSFSLNPQNDQVNSDLEYKRPPYRR